MLSPMCYLSISFDLAGGDIGLVDWIVTQRRSAVGIV